MDRTTREQQTPGQRAGCVVIRALDAYAKWAKLESAEAVTQKVLTPWLQEHHAFERDPDEAAALALDGCRATHDGGYIATGYLLASVLFCQAALTAEGSGNERLAWSYAVDCATYAASLVAEFGKLDQAQSDLKARAARARHGADAARKAAAVGAYLGGEYGTSRNQAADQIAQAYGVERGTARRWLQGVPDPPTAPRQRGAGKG